MRVLGITAARLPHSSARCTFIEPIPYAALVALDVIPCTPTYYLRTKKTLSAAPIGLLCCPAPGRWQQAPSVIPGGARLAASSEINTHAVLRALIPIHALTLWVACTCVCSLDAEPSRLRVPLHLEADGSGRWSLSQGTAPMCGAAVKPPSGACVSAVGAVRHPEIRRGAGLAHNPGVLRPRGRLAHEAEDVGAGEVVGCDRLGAHLAYDRVVKLQPLLAAARRRRPAHCLVVPAALPMRTAASATRSLDHGPYCGMPPWLMNLLLSAAWHNPLGAA